MKLRRQSIYGLAGLIAVFGLLIAAPQMFPLIGGAAIGLAVRWVLQCLIERRGKPPVLHMWEDGTEHRLTVRHRTTDEVLAGFAEASLARRDLRGICWERVNLNGVDLAGADLTGASLSGSAFVGANLQGAHLDNADLSYAVLATGLIAGASFRGADLRGADFVGSGAGRVLWNSALDNVELVGARYNRSTRWPWGFDPTSRGCVLVENAELGLPIPAESAEKLGVSLPVAADAPVQHDDERVVRLRH